MKKRKVTAQHIVGVVLFFTLGLSAVYALVRFVCAPDIVPEDSPSAKGKSDYLLMLTQCILGVIVMLLPSIINRKWSVPIPRKLYTVYYVFLYCAIFLGEVFDFYYVVPHWDTILHGFSGAMLSALGFILVDLLNMNQRVSVNLSLFFESVFAFCFALSLGAIWEIYEYAGDMILGLNMQKAYLSGGTALCGRAALKDTMEDLVVDAIAAAIVAIAGYKANMRKAEAERNHHEDPKAG